MLESSLLLENPRPYYADIDLGFRMFMLVTKFLPTYYGDRLILKMWGDHVEYKLIWECNSIEDFSLGNWRFVRQMKFIIKSSGKYQQKNNSRMIRQSKTFRWRRRAKKIEQPKWQRKFWSNNSNARRTVGNTKTNSLGLVAKQLGLSSP